MRCRPMLMRVKDGSSCSLGFLLNVDLYGTAKEVYTIAFVSNNVCRTYSISCSTDLCHIRTLAHNFRLSRMNSIFRLLIILIALLLFLGGPIDAQTTAAAKAGSATAKGGFRNEDEILDKFNNWRTDDDAKVWLRTMSYDPSKIQMLTATK